MRKSKLLKKLTAVTLSAAMVLSMSACSKSNGAGTDKKGNPITLTVFSQLANYNHNYATNIKLEVIASLFGYNSAYLGKIFNKTVGESFNSYVDKVRIDHAIELLMDNKLKVYEIAERIGYKNVDYFHKKFKKYIGVSPAEYRNKKSEE